MRRAGHTAGMGETINLNRIFIGMPEGKNHSEDLGIGVKIILERILGKRGGKMWTRFIWLRIGTSVGLL